MPARGVLAWPAVEVVPTGPLTGAIAAPASKSVTNRLLAVAALAAGRSRLRQPLQSDDSTAMRGLVGGLGAAVHDDGGAWVVDGTGGDLAVPRGPLNALLSGTTMRFGSALATLAPQEVVVDGGAPLRRRPVGPLTTALRALGASIGDRGGFPPVRAGGSGGIRGGRVVVDARASSQFASAVLLVAPYAGTDVDVTVSGDAALDYIELTASVMGAWGAGVERVAADRWTVVAGRRYGPRDVAVPYDASAAAHLYALAAATGGRVQVLNAILGGGQPDEAVLDVFEKMGATVERGAGVTVTGPDRLRAADGVVDLSSLPDQVTTVAALAALAHGTTTIRGVAVVRGHETDRIAALASELGRLGVRTEELPDGLVVHGGVASGPARLSTHDDHRLAMAFAAVAAAVPGVVLDDPGCVAKTFPMFWEAVVALGGHVVAGGRGGGPP